MSESVCEKLYRLDEQSDSSMGTEPHIPPEAQITPDVSPPELPVDEAKKIECQDGIPVLPIEIVVQEDFQHTSRFLLSPSGTRMLLTTNEGVSLLDLDTGDRRQTGLEGFPRFWIDEYVLVLSRHETDQLGFHAHDFETGHGAPFDIRWEYNDLPVTSVIAPLYTGWQASECLEIRKETICNAVQDGRLGTVEATDGSLLLYQEDLLEHGADLIREAHPELLPYDEIAALRLVAQDIRSVLGVPMKSPILQSYWPRILVLTGLPEEPENMLIHVSSESHWQDHPSVNNQLVIDKGGSAAWTDTNAEFFVARDSCSSSEARDYPYLLYQRKPEDQQPVVVGRIPYSIDYWSMMVWLPNGQYIYMKHPIEGRFAVSRLRLPAQIALQP